ncbi:nicotinamide-nucleotide adenylyltransferase [Methanorbis furvi]|uniref:Nicotinamide-nucleotide adenylyltransferase n=1 Tax=Methanorbis furvi TaxID=3028299 RepID=A0AAE4MCS8_9EURY|nr:Bifunctional NMN adenylyltransferase/Nudix hydrolase [Methanocorpusculaceae archaeon Ag1]
MKRGLYVGRFQPYHNGHNAVIDSIAHDVDELIIGIGSAEISHDLRHPFTAGERVLMISRALKNIDIPIYIIPLEDVKRNALWVSHVKSMTPPFDTVYTSNPLVIQLFREAGITVTSPPMYQREMLSGTSIRARMIAGENWDECVPPEVADVIREIHGIDRIRQIAKTD